MPVRQHGPHIPMQRLLLFRIKTETPVVLGIKWLLHIERGAFIEGRAAFRDGGCIKVTAIGLICRKK